MIVKCDSLVQVDSPEVESVRVGVQNVLEHRAAAVRISLLVFGLCEVTNRPDI